MVVVVGEHSHGAGASSLGMKAGAQVARGDV